jgi:DNA adenine methylase
MLLIISGIMGRSTTTYPARWRSGKTTVIRVPEKLAGGLLEIARRWDASDETVLREEHGTLILDFLDLPRQVKYEVHRPVNVSSVPQRSPFRYPGGKTWLVPHLRSWLKSRKCTANRFVEPFAGGAISSLTAGFERLAKHVIFAELDEGVAAVWRVVLNGQAKWLADRILSFDLSEENVRLVLGESGGELRDEAFRTLLRNRVQRGGILAKGAGLVKTGETGRGLNARWYPETLARRITEINEVKDRFSFVHGDGLSLIREHLNDKDTVFYIDPPYMVAARRLYTHWDIDHREVFRLMSQAKGDFLMSYDNTPEIQALASEFGFTTRQIAMKNTHHAKMTELLIGHDLSFLDP